MKLYRINFTDCTNNELRDRISYWEAETMKECKQIAKQYYYGYKKVTSIEYIGVGGYELLDQLKKEGKE